MRYSPRRSPAKQRLQAADDLIVKQRTLAQLQAAVEDLHRKYLNRSNIDSLTLYPTGQLVDNIRTLTFGDGLLAETTVFEHPLSEKCRTWLRLSHLFEQFDFHTPRAGMARARAAVSRCWISPTCWRARHKSRLLGTERYCQSLARMANSPSVDTERLHGYCTSW